MSTLQSKSDFETLKRSLIVCLINVSVLRGRTSPPKHACPINRPVCACKRFQAGMDAAPDLILCVPYLETSATKGSMYFLNSSLRVEPLLAWKYSLDLNVTIRRTRGHDGLDCSKTLKKNLKIKFR